MLRIALFAAAFASAALFAEEEHHEHHAPHGGTLVVFGEEAAHVELLLDAEAGILTAWVLDGEAENAIRIAQREIVIEIEWPAEKEGAERRKSELTLKGVANVLTGESEGDTSQFSVEAKELKGALAWDGVVTKIVIKGVEFEKTAFNFPKGNEPDDDEETPRAR